MQIIRSAHEVSVPVGVFDFVDEVIKAYYIEHRVRVVLGILCDVCITSWNDPRLRNGQTARRQW